MKELNIWKEKYVSEHRRTRIGCRAILMKEGKILLSYEAKKNYYFTPGGGLEEGETIEEGCIREVGEECGVAVKIISPFMKVHCYYKDCDYESHFFICEESGSVPRNLTEQEEEDGMIPVFIPLEEAINIFKTYKDYEESVPMLSGSYLRDYHVLMEFSKSLKS